MRENVCRSEEAPRPETEADAAAACGRIIAQVIRACACELGDQSPFSAQFLERAEQWEEWASGHPNPAWSERPAPLPGDQGSAVRLLHLLPPIA